MPPFPECDVLCLLGAKKPDVEKALQWLDGKRRLYLVSCEEHLARSSPTISSKGAQDGASDLFSMGREHCQMDKESLIEDKDEATDCADLPRGCEKCGLEHPRVRSFRAETLIEQQMAANEIGWGAVLRSLEVVAEKGFEAMRERIQESSRAAHLLLSETADWGIRAFSNARVNWEQNGPFTPLASLKDSLKGVPAIVCGAGPSLEEAKPFLKELCSKALLIAAGTAASLFQKWGIEPHLVAALDKDTPPERLACISHNLSSEGAQNGASDLFSMGREHCQMDKESPIEDKDEAPFCAPSPRECEKCGLGGGPLLCMQSRLNPEAVSSFGGVKILAPESGSIPWESWWLDEKEPMEFGWTVGNFATGVALYLGCDPIIWAGMDFCYRGEIKYADGLEQEETELVSTVNRRGRPVLTQHDWLAAANWHRQLASWHPERRWICTSLEGLSLGEAVQSMEWKTIAESLSGKNPARLQDAVSAAPKMSFDPSRKTLWEESIRRSLEACGRLEGEALEEEVVYRFYLAPLWRLWGPLFAREANEQDLDGHRLLFFKEVLQTLQVPINVR